jgi:hypothetical protein
MEEHIKTEFIAESASEIVEHTDTDVCLILTLDRSGSISILSANNNRKFDSVTEYLTTLVTQAIFRRDGGEEGEIPKLEKWFSKVKRNVH